ncbi:hypothetical protein GY501_004003, partial [Escherichia coli]|nr:hypothetical protein [Escherichia coli]
RQPSGKNIIRWLLKKRTNGSVRYCQYTSHHRERWLLRVRRLTGCLRERKRKVAGLHLMKT